MWVQYRDGLTTDVTTQPNQLPREYGHLNEDDRACVSEMVEASRGAFVTLRSMYQSLSETLEPLRPFVVFLSRPQVRAFSGCHGMVALS